MNKRVLWIVLIVLAVAAIVTVVCVVVAKNKSSKGVTYVYDSTACKVESTNETMQQATAAGMDAMASAMGAVYSEWTLKLNDSEITLINGNGDSATYKYTKDGNKLVIDTKDSEKILEAMKSSLDAANQSLGTNPIYTRIIETTDLYFVQEGDSLSWVTILSETNTVSEAYAGMPGLESYSITTTISFTFKAQ